MGVVAQNNIFRNLNKDGKLTFYASKLWSNLNVKFFWYDVKDMDSTFIKIVKKDDGFRDNLQHENLI
jgi:hypothetical protein